jgi:hypothetical protein
MRRDVYVSLPILNVHTNSPQVSGKHPAIQIFVCQVAHTPASFMVHHDERTTIFRRTGNGLVDFNADGCPISSGYIM